jgi:hypothetical protein
VNVKQTNRPELLDDTAARSTGHDRRINGHRGQRGFKAAVSRGVAECRNRAFSWLPIGCRQESVFVPPATPVSGE